MKLLDYRNRWEELERSTNVFAVVVMAWLETLATRHDAEGRLRAKWGLVRRLYQRGLSRQDVLDLFWFIDWLMFLPAPVQKRFVENVRRHEEETRMRYVTTIERMAKDEGLQEGLQEGIEEGLQQGERRALLRMLERRFAPVPEEVDARLQGMTAQQLDDLVGVAVDAASFEEFVRGIPAPAGGSEA